MLNPTIHPSKGWTQTRENARQTLAGVQANPMGETTGMARGVRILVADDQLRARQSLKALLATCPLVGPIQEATNGREALARVEESPPDLILMDIRMPEMDGLEATRRIKARWPQIQIIALSVYTEHMDEALSAGANAFVCKCEPPAKLLTVLEQVMTRSQPQ